VISASHKYGEEGRLGGEEWQPSVSDSILESLVSRLTIVVFSSKTLTGLPQCLFPFNVGATR